MAQEQQKNSFPIFLATLPVRAVGAMAGIFVVFNACLRIVFFSSFAEDFSLTPKNIVEVLGSGFINDFATLCFVLLPAVFILFLLPSRLFIKKSGRFITLASVFIFTVVIIFSSIAEYFFWDEFHGRFNFIAVDYLIYTTEVINNIKESYPLLPIFVSIALISCLITAIVWKWIAKVRYPYPMPIAKRICLLFGNVLFAVLIFFIFTPLSGGSDRYWKEASHNGIYELFSAFRHNTIDYRAFYKLLAEQEAFSLMRKELAEPTATFFTSDPKDLRRNIVTGTSLASPNVIVVVMESMGSDKKFKEYTPNLNALAANGISFSNMLSTGTRTVRGLEAIMLSIPPTPGNSIVRRPDNENLFTLGTIFRERGYDRDFIYGGIGYFDNMNAFFAGNGYTVTDKLSFVAQNKTFSTAWGQCDEDLYAESLRLADRSFAEGKPFHQVLLTTSNHRPFTFPQGKIDMEQGSRRAVIKYADYAIGKFIQEAKAKPWFENSIFVFVGDHPSSVAGKTEVPASAYGIVCFMYGPKFFDSETVQTLCSQIDVGPTLLAILGWEYRSQFFGTNARILPLDAGRAWISTYQLLGFRTNDQLVVLRPDGSAKVSMVDPVASDNLDSKNKDMLAQNDTQLVARSVASYQCAYDLFSRKQMKESALLTSLLSLMNKETDSALNR